MFGEPEASKTDKQPPKILVEIYINFVGNVLAKVRHSFVLIQALSAFRSLYLLSIIAFLKIVGADSSGPVSRAEERIAH